MATDLSLVSVDSEPDETSPEAGEAACQENAAPEAVAEPTPEWRGTPIDVLGLPPSLTERLAAAELATMGALEDFRAANAEHPENWPSGIGPAKVEKIEAALLAWMARREASPIGEVVYPSADEFRSWSDDKQIEWLRSRAGELNCGDTSKMHASVPAGCGAAFENGNDAYTAGELVANCDLPPGPECDAWLLGWLLARSGHYGVTAE
jgi:hypothetical protein